MSVTSSQFMYSLTLQPAGTVTHAAVGNFDPRTPKQQQVVVARCERLSMHVIGSRQNEWKTLFTHNTFGILRKIAPVRIPGTPSDLLIVTSDSGRITLLQYNPDKNRFDRIHLETYGKSGIRRTIPGMYLAVDPRGRCCMIGAPEKNKIVYILNRDQEQKVTISSPQEVNQPQIITFAMCAVDANYQNPLFAALEVACNDIDQDPTDISYNEREKLLVYYRVDLGLNHVVREWASPVDYSSNMLFQVPGGSDGPSGVLVCGLGMITYRHYDHEPLTVKIPRRRGPAENPDRDRRIVSGVLIKLKATFLLLQTDDGDIFKLTLTLDVDHNNQMLGTVSNMELRYFDTLPVSSTLSTFRHERALFMYAAVESGDNHVYQFQDFADDEPLLCSSQDYEPSVAPATFETHSYTHLRPWLVSSSLNPQIRALVDDIEAKDEQRIFSVCGTGPRSTLRMTSHGLPTTEDMRASLPRPPQQIWTVTNDRFSQSDKYMVIALPNETWFLEIFGSDTQRVFNTGMKEDVRTLHVGSMGDFGIIQVWNRGFRYFVGKDRKPADWSLPAHKTIFQACSNHQQLVLALSTGEILYFEVSQDMLSMQEYNQGPQTLYMDGAVHALSMGDVPEGSQRAPFLAIGVEDSSRNSSLHILSLDPNGSMLERTTINALTARPHSIEIMAVEDVQGMTNHVHVGLASGVYLRAQLDYSGQLSDARKWFLGLGEVNLAPLIVNDQRVMLACGYKTHLAYTHPETKTYLITPLDYDQLKGACMLKVEGLGQVIIGITKTDLCRIAIPDLSTHLLTKVIPLRHTPRDFCRHPKYRYLHVVQSDANTLPMDLVESLQVKQEGTKSHKFDADQQFAWPRGNNYWSSCIQIVDPLAKPEDKQILYTLELKDNEAALCCAMVPFKSQDDEQFLVVGTGKNMVGAGKPKDASSETSSPGFVHIYRVHEQGKELEFIHKTELASPITAIHAFQGQLALAVDNELFIYDIGTRALLRKARCRIPGVKIMSITSSGFRLVVGDIKQSIFYVAYNPLDEKKKLVPFADDALARYTTAFTMLDYDTSAGGDKFGNFWIVRCPREASDEADEQGTANLLKAKRGYLNGTPYRLEAQVHDFVQDVPKSIQRTRFLPGAEEVVFWAGLQGTLGMFVPFEKREDVEFFCDLEMRLRSEDKPLAGREHHVYRGYYQPPKGCVDGDLCERFMLLDRGVKEGIAAEMEKDVADIEKKIGEMRSRVAF